jgi:hypothetical protein
MSERESSTRLGSLHHGRNAGVALIAAGAVAASMIIVPTAARADDGGWPQGKLTKADATSVKKGQFIARSQFEVWRGQLDRVGPAGQPGLRAAGSSAQCEGDGDSAGQGQEGQDTQRDRVHPGTVEGVGDPLLSHTDGTNALEDNGPDAIVAMSQYLSRLPRKALPRTVMVLLTAGHFAGGVGAKHFVKEHRDNLVRRSRAALEIEHLGAREWAEVTPGKMGPTGRYEAGAIFAPDSKGLVDAGSAALKRGIYPSGVLRPLNPDGNGATVAVWPGEGQYLYALGGMLTGNYITGPTYLLNWGIKTGNKIDEKRVRDEAISFTEMLVQLGRTSAADLKATTTP